MVHYFHLVLQHWRAVAWSAGVLVVSVVCALVVRWVVFFFLKRIAARHKSVIATSLIHHGGRLSRWFFPLLALLVAFPGTSLPEQIMKPIQHAIGIALIAVLAWLVILVSEVVSDVLTARYKVDTADNLLARKVETQLAVLHRVISVAVVLIALGLILMTFPAIHSIGTSLLASAGLAGLVIGVAMKPTISSLVAGIQIALTQPMRLEDVVIVEGEWGWIEEITTTYVVVRIWDLRRLVLPLSYFIENPFQNWTRTSADLLGTVMLWVDYTVPVGEVREELQRIVKTTNLWKGEVCALQVTDANERAIQLRALVDARDSGAQWDLRCYVREKLIEFLQQKYPGCLPRLRGELETSANGSRIPEVSQGKVEPQRQRQRPRLQRPVEHK
jgi:small-conductance mechanosensitive channel